jgi:hypothetical protein
MLARGFEDVEVALRVGPELIGGRDASQGRHRQVHHRIHVIRANDALNSRGVGDVELLDEAALADLVLEKVGLAAVRVIRDDHILAGIEKTSGGVEPDEAHPTDEQRASHALLERQP